MKKSGFDRIMKTVSVFFLSFLLVAFITTLCVSLFISVLQKTMDVTFTNEDIEFAAKWTMLAVIIMSAVFALIDILQKKYTVEKPMEKIVEATEKMIDGDFSVRIDKTAKILSDGTFVEIADSINKMAQELSGVETLRSDFIANVSHEMKTPLAVIQNYGRLMQTPNLSEEKRLEYAKIITDASGRLSDMVVNVLKLNRLENQQIYPNPKIYDLGEQLCTCLLQYENVWESKNIEIETDIPDDVTVRADGELLQLVWSNLFSNAFKFTENGGSVKITLSADDDFAVVTVKDTGCGMESEVGGHIFEKFYQGDTSHATQGNGLGLALVKRVIDITESEISVESRVGEGTAFTVKIRRGQTLQ